VEEPKKVYRWKRTGELYELTQELPDGNLDLRPLHPKGPVKLLTAAPHEVELVTDPE